MNSEIPPQGPTRRTFLRRSAAVGALSSIGAFLPRQFSAETAQAQDAAKTDPAVIETWMDEWLKNNRAADGNLVMSRFADPIYFLLKPMGWKPNSGQSGYQPVQVPIGFVTDFASVPRVFWSLLRPDGLYAYPAIVHDYMYWTQDRPKEVADSILKFGMEDFGVDSVTSGAIYAAVSNFGSSSWDENRRLKASGEKRTLRKFPTDPTTRWAEWKKGDVF
jgi:hypothetical protein